MAIDLMLKQVNDIKLMWEELIRKMIPPSVMEVQLCGRNKYRETETETEIKRETETTARQKQQH